MKRATFDKMVEILQKGYAEKHRRCGRTPKLSIEDPLLATLEYLREYRTYRPSDGTLKIDRTRSGLPLVLVSYTITYRS